MFKLFYQSSTGQCIFGHSFCLKYSIFDEFGHAGIFQEEHRKLRELISEAFTCMLIDTLICLGDQTHYLLSVHPLTGNHTSSIP